MRRPFPLVAAVVVLVTACGSRAEPTVSGDTAPVTVVSSIPAETGTSSPTPTTTAESPIEGLDICDADRFDSQFFNVVDSFAVDLEGDGVLETAIVHRGNNFSSMNFFTASDCGHALVRLETGLPVDLIVESSSVVCWPFGCVTRAECTDDDGGPRLRVATVAPTMTDEEIQAWHAGEIADADVTGEIRITDYELLDATLVERGRSTVPLRGTSDPELDDLVALPTLSCPS